MAFTYESLISRICIVPLLILCAQPWYSLVNSIVPEPYLDEVFHVGQARAYLRGQWEIWDPKITTPPGLYLASWPFLKTFLAFDSLHILPQLFADASAFRCINFIGSALLPSLVLSLLNFNVRVHDGKCAGKHKANVRCKYCLDWSYGELFHTTINVYLFPPLFFFYGLYYTDVLSVVSVLYAYRCYLARQHTRVIFAGLLSLLFRQTNIFWVSVFLGGLEVCRSIPKGRLDIEFPKQPTFYDVIEGSWQHASAYDPLISQACFEDYIKTSVSYAIAGLARLSTVMWSLSPYLVVLSAFTEFVIWNRGVVLGDKENHVASIHLTQMIYIWPYFAFFSSPLIYRQVLPATIRPLRFAAAVPRKVVSCTTMAVMLVVIHYNTIVHPFTLADNRHYMFYVFRILLRHPLLKYLAVLVYYNCAWAVLSALGGRPTGGQASEQGPSSKKRKVPGLEPFPPSPQLDTSPVKRTKSEERSPSSLPLPAFGPRMTEIPQQDGISPAPPKKQKKRSPGHRASFILIWFLATSLSIITTPLVEPRYLIVPWMIWRLHLASPRPKKDHAEAGEKKPDGTGEKLLEAFKAVLYERHDHRLWLETMWFLIINLATGYIFLYWGFEWPQEPGKVQRFMW